MARQTVDQIVIISPDPTFTTFVAKTQKAKTRKGKDYYVLRVTIPKEISDKIEAGPDDYLVLRAKKASWYHMLNWKGMEQTWRMLPQDIRRGVALDGIPNPDTPNMITASSSNRAANWQGVATTPTGTSATAFETPMQLAPEP